MRYRISLLILLLASAATPAQAQVAGVPATPAAPSVGEILSDRVIAIVGDTALLNSDLAYEVNQYRAGGALPQDSVGLERAIQQILEGKINDLILVSAARDAGINPSEEAVNDITSQELARIQQQFGSDVAFTAALAREGITRDQLRRDLSTRVRDRLLVDEYARTRMQSRAPPLISESEIREFFDAQATANIGQRPATVSFRQVLVTPEPSDEARQAAIARGDEVLRELDSGGDFEVLARRFSDDVGSREFGGDLGWFSTGRMVAEFERAAFSMRVGSTSGLVESPFGFHIIRVDRARGAERQARHILIQPEITPADVARARERADSVATAIRGGAAIATLAERYNEPTDQASVNRAILESVPPEYRNALENANVNELIGPVEIPSPRGSRWAVIRLTELTQAGEYTLDDVRDQIRETLQQQMMQEQLLRELRERYYVNVLL